MELLLVIITPWWTQTLIKIYGGVKGLVSKWLDLQSEFFSCFYLFFTIFEFSDVIDLVIRRISDHLSCSIGF